METRCPSCGTGHDADALARVLEAAGRVDEATAARERAAAVLGPLGVVNPY